MVSFWCCFFSIKAVTKVWVCVFVLRACQRNPDEYAVTEWFREPKMHHPGFAS